MFDVHRGESRIWTFDVRDIGKELDLVNAVLSKCLTSMWKRVGHGCSTSVVCERVGLGRRPTSVLWEEVGISGHPCGREFNLVDV